MQNGYVESFNGKMRDELLNETLFFSLDQAREAVAAWAEDYNTTRPHSSLGYRPPAPEVISWPALPDSSPVARPARTPLVENRPLN
mgnify:CR=1 FL=1